VNAELWLLALGTLASEDLTCLAAGVLVAQGRLSLISATLACLLGIFAGDMLLFLAGRWLGRPALRWGPLARRLPAASVDRATAWLTQRGMAVILLSRFTPGLRLPTYFAAGLLPTPMRTFALHFLLAAALWTPLLVGGASWLGEGVFRAWFDRGRHGMLAFAVVLLLALCAYRALRPLLTWSGRRRAFGFLQRKLRWEFWPAWAAYLPLIPYLLYLAGKHRSFTLFTAANPGIATGGLAGESKSQILTHLNRVPGAVAEFFLVPEHSKDELLQRFPWPFPVVLKPDVGERGEGVAVIRTHEDLRHYMNRAAFPIIVQRYIPGAEFGVFYCRYPGQATGCILSITEKRFPQVTGNGVNTLRELILGDRRAVCLAAAYQKAAQRPLTDVPAQGESVQLVELGSHCRGAVFLNGWQLKTDALEAAIDRISQSHPGFYFGRFDIRVPDIQEFQQGGGFKVIELNGVAGEATHVYDPAVSLLEAYRVMFRQWRIAFEIGSRNRAQGAAPMPLLELLRVVARHQQKSTTNAPRAEARLRTTCPDASAL
jgi:membrane protein DedA with SNARE-associated domain